MSDPIKLEQLQWPRLLEHLAAGAQTSEGRTACLALKPDFTAEDITLRWKDAIPVRDLLRAGFRPPIGELPLLRPIFRGARLGQMLDGESLWAVCELLKTTQRLHQFLTDRQDRCSPLRHFHSQIFPLPKLARAIEKAITPEGTLQDHASPELQRIRQQKLSMRKRIEQMIRQLLSEQELELYVQDKFFTVRSERYVVPIRIDGRGRIKGSIYDTSDSGQTLYMELHEVRPLNDALIELDSAEKIEIIRIFRELSAMVSGELEILTRNYEELIALDILTAEAALAMRLEAGPAQITEDPCLQLIQARHPLIILDHAVRPCANTIVLEPNQSCLIVSGPNAGGKTVVLKTVGLIHLMAKARLLLPVDEASAISLFPTIYIAIGDAQDLASQLSTFSGHLQGLRPILQEAKSHDLVLLDELGAGTEPQTASALGQAILEDLANRRVTCVVTTHFDSLKSLALDDPRFRNGAMEFSSLTLQPTYKLILDLPGQSYGIEVAEHVGLPHHVLERAKELRGRTGTIMDKVLDSWTRLREEAEQEKRHYHQLKLQMESQKFRWEQERKELADTKQNISERIRNRYQTELDELKQSYWQLLDESKHFIREQERKPADVALLKEGLRKRQQEFEAGSQTLQQQLHKIHEEFRSSIQLPGVTCSLEDLSVGARVFMVSIGREAVVSKLQKAPHPSIEVTAGLLKLRPSIQDLRLLVSEGEDVRKPKGKLPEAVQAHSETIHFVLPSPTNSLDLRGLDSDTAMHRAWSFIDKALLRGESSVILIHGHGTDTLKKSLRRALAKDAPYALDFRSGEPEEGGDGVTVVTLRS